MAAIASRDQNHQVKTGESLSSIAGKYGHPDWRVIWNDPKNTMLVMKRKHSSDILPGDMLYIPLTAAEQKQDLENARKHALELLGILKDHKFESNVLLRELPLRIRLHVESSSKMIDDLVAKKKKIKSMALIGDATAFIGTAIAAIPATLANAERVCAAEAVAKIKAPLLQKSWTNLKLLMKAGATSFSYSTNAIRNYSAQFGKLQGSETKMLDAIGNVGKFILNATSPSYIANVLSHKDKTWTEAARTKVGDEFDKLINTYGKKNNELLQTMKERWQAEQARNLELEKLIKIVERELDDLRFKETITRH